MTPFLIMKIIDLTMPLDTRTPVYPGDPKPIFEQSASIEQEGYNTFSIKLNSHMGTHIDAPDHFIKNGKTLDKFPLDRFIGNGIIVNAKGKKEINSFEEKIRKNDIVIFYTSHSKNIYRNYFDNAPFISEKVAKRLARIKPSIVGIDSFSVDKEPFNVHKILLKNNVLILENLVNLDKLINKKFKVIVLPLKLSLDASPCRAVAVVD